MSRFKYTLWFFALIGAVISFAAAAASLTMGKYAPFFDFYVHAGAVLFWACFIPLLGIGLYEKRKRGKDA